MHIITDVNIFASSSNDYMTFKIDGDSTGIGGSYGDQIIFTYVDIVGVSNNYNSADIPDPIKATAIETLGHNYIISAIFIDPQKRIPGKAGLCLHETTSCVEGSIVQFWPQSFEVDTIEGQNYNVFNDYYGNPHYVAWINIYPQEEFVSMNLDGHSWGLSGYEPNCISPDVGLPGLGCIKPIHYGSYYPITTDQDESRNSNISPAVYVAVCAEPYYELDDDGPV